MPAIAADNRTPPRPPIFVSLLRRRGALAAMAVVLLIGAEGWKNFSTVRATAAGAVEAVQAFGRLKETGITSAPGSMRSPPRSPASREDWIRSSGRRLRPPRTMPVAPGPSSRRRGLSSC